MVARLSVDVDPAKNGNVVLFLTALKIQPSEDRKEENFVIA